jgi:putative hydrolase of the HAD superfamily
MILVFDLDDTLYDEITYVKSGFQAVAAYLFIEYGIPKKASFEFMLKHLGKEGRHKIFDAVLNHYSIFSKRNVIKCVRIYHTHTPKIRLYPAAIRCLKRFKHNTKYLITDGNKIVQGNKVKALGLDRYMKFCYVTHRYGLNHAKPSTYCFEKICEKERVEPSQVVFVGDNPHKDFIGLKPKGFNTIRLLKGAHKGTKLSNRHEASIHIKSLNELTHALLKLQLQRI